MEEPHRRIELQSTSDLQYLVANASQAARNKIDLHFPPNPMLGSNDKDSNGLNSSVPAEDPMRRRVEELVQTFIEDTFQSVRKNISINGLHGADMDNLLKEAGIDGQEVEPFDSNLAKRIQHVSTNIEVLQLQLADLRRTAPARTAARYTANLDAEDQKRRAELTLAQQRDIRQATEDVQLNVTGLEDIHDMQKSWEESAQTLSKLGENIGVTFGKVEQAQAGLAYIKGA